MGTRAIFITIAAAYLLTASSPAIAQSDPPAGVHRALPDNSRVLAVKRKTFGQMDYTFVKYISADGAFQEMVFDTHMREASPDLFSPPTPQIIQPDLERLLVDMPEQTHTIPVNVVLKVDDEDTAAGSDAVVTVDEAVTDPLAPTFSLNGEVTTEQHVVNHAERRHRQRDLTRTGRLRNATQKRALLHEALSLPKIRPDSDIVEVSSDTVTIVLTRSQIQMLGSRPDLIISIEPYVAPEDTADKQREAVQPAMKRTNIDPYALKFGRTGDGIGIYMTESGCAPTGHIDNYSKLDGRHTSHAENVSAIMRTVSPESWIYCRGGAKLPHSTDMDGVDDGPAILVVNRSNGGGDDGKYTAVDRAWDNFVYDYSVVTFVSAGNNGRKKGYLVSPSNGYNIVSVGAYNDANNTIAPFSSHKDPGTGAEKPEISAPGVDIYAGGHTKSGTSMSAPHAAAFAADMIGSNKWLKRKPAAVKAAILGGATDRLVGGGEKVGRGGIDFYKTVYHGYMKWWSGRNKSFFSEGSGGVSPALQEIQQPCVGEFGMVESRNVDV